MELGSYYENIQVENFEVFFNIFILSQNLILFCVKHLIAIQTLNCIKACLLRPYLPQLFRVDDCGLITLRPLGTTCRTHTKMIGYTPCYGSTWITGIRCLGYIAQGKNVRKRLKQTNLKLVEHYWVKKGLTTGLFTIKVKISFTGLEKLSLGQNYTR